MTYWSDTRGLRSAAARTAGACRGTALVCAVFLIGIESVARATTPTVTPTPTATAIPCVGDCDGNGAVTINELLNGVNIALGTTPPTECRAFDLNADDAVTVDELVMGVNAALNECAPLPTPTMSGAPSPTPTSSVCRRDQIAGVVYAVTARPGNVLAGATVDCAASGTSECIAPCGQSSLTTGADGAFAFSVNHYFGQFTIVASAQGYQSAECSVRCDYYTGCQSCTIVLPRLSR